MNSTSGVPAQAEPILSAKCHEKRGDVIRSVYPIALTIDNLKVMWEKFSQFRTILGYEVKDDFWFFVSLFVELNENEVAKARGLYWSVDDFVGMFYLTNIDGCDDALVHYTFFDRVFSGRQDLIVQMLHHVFSKYGFHRLSIEIPAFATPYTKIAAQRLGFIAEGTKRYSRHFDGKMFHVNHYGILKTEFYSRYGEALNGK